MNAEISPDLLKRITRLEFRTRRLVDSAVADWTAFWISRLRIGNMAQASIRRAASCTAARMR